MENQITQKAGPISLSKEEIEKIIEAKLIPIKKELKEVKDEIAKLKKALQTTDSTISRMGRRLRNSSIN